MPTLATPPPHLLQTTAKLRAELGSESEGRKHRLGDMRAMRRQDMVWSA